MVKYALCDAKVNVGSNILLHNLTVFSICKIQNWCKLYCWYKNSISIVIGNRITKNNNIPNDIVKSSANIISTLSKRGLHNLILCQPDFCLCKCVGQAQLFKKVFHIFLCLFYHLQLMVYLFVQVVYGRLYQKCYFNIKIYHYVPAR